MDQPIESRQQQGGRGLGRATQLDVTLREEASASTKKALTASITMATYQMDDISLQHGQTIRSRGLKVVERHHWTHRELESNMAAVGPRAVRVMLTIPLSKGRGGGVIIYWWWEGG